MSNDSCVLLYPCSLEAGHDMKSMSNSDVSSDEVHRVGSSHQSQRKASGGSCRDAIIDTMETTNVRPLDSSSGISSSNCNNAFNQHLCCEEENEPGRLVSQELSPKLRALRGNEEKVNDVNKKNNTSRRRNRSDAGVDQAMGTNDETDSTTTNDAASNGEQRRSTPQHEAETKREWADDMTYSSSFPPLDADFETALLTQRNKRVLLSRLLEVAPRGRLSMVSICFSQLCVLVVIVFPLSI